MSVTLRLVPLTIKHVQAINEMVGMAFFDKSNMRFFNSKLHGSLHENRFFITSERYPDHIDRRYTVRCMNHQGRIETIGKFYEITTYDQALQQLRDIIVQHHTIASKREDPDTCLLLAHPEETAHE